MSLVLRLLPICIGLMGYWALWRSRTRMKPQAVALILTIAFVYAMVKGVLWPDSTSRYPLVDGSLMLLGFLLVTGFRVDLLARQESLKPGERVHPRRNRFIFVGLCVGIAMCAVFDFVLKPQLGAPS